MSSQTRTPSRARRQPIFFLILAVCAGAFLPLGMDAQGQVATRHGAADGWVGGPGLRELRTGDPLGPIPAGRPGLQHDREPPTGSRGVRSSGTSGKTGTGTFYYLVDAEQGSQRQIFDNDRIAAELTRITLDPWDGQSPSHPEHPVHRPEHDPVRGGVLPG